MSRRVVAMAASAFLLVLMLAVALLQPVPFVVQGPGPTVDTLAQFEGEPVMEISGADTYDAVGQLHLTTVTVTSPGSEITLPEAIAAWVDSDVAILPTEAVYPPDVSAEEIREGSQQEMQFSQESAIIAGLRYVDVDVTETVAVSAVTEGAPADGVLEAGDEILEVAGQPIETAQDVVDATAATTPGESVDFTVERDGEVMTIMVPTEESPTAPEQARVGISVGPGYESPVDVEININPRIGGPSAGLVFAVTIVELLTPQSLLDGQFVMGTGTINVAGEVGPIGGIEQKVAAAVEAGAEAFLVPAGNCEAAARAHSDSDILLVDVPNLETAVTALTDLAAGRRDAVPRC